MPWQSLRIPVSRDFVETTTDLLFSAGAVSITLTDAQDEPLLEPGPLELPLWSQAYIHALFEQDTLLDPIVKDLQELLGTSLIVELENVPDQAWERMCLEHFQPMCFGKSLWIVPTWHWDGTVKEREIILDPGLAFGTGSHPTTRLMLEFLDGYDCRGKTVLDYGCGSGILALAASILGAASIFAIDHDKQALIATKENATKNGCQERIHTFLPADLPRLEADLILANIVLNPLLSLHDTFKSHLKPDGLLVVSGLLESQRETFLKAYEANFKCVEVVEQEGWLRMTLKSSLSL